MLGLPVPVRYKINEDAHVIVIHRFGYRSSAYGRWRHTDHQDWRKPDWGRYAVSNLARATAPTMLDTTDPVLSAQAPVR